MVNPRLVVESEGEVGRVDDSRLAGSVRLAALTETGAPREGDGEGDETELKLPIDKLGWTRGVVAGRGNGGAKAFRLVDLRRSCTFPAVALSRLVGKRRLFLLKSPEGEDDVDEVDREEGIDTEGERVPSRSGASLGKMMGTAVLSEADALIEHADLRSNLLAAVVDEKGSLWKSTMMASGSSLQSNKTSPSCLTSRTSTSSAMIKDLKAGSPSSSDELDSSTPHSAMEPVRRMAEKDPRRVGWGVRRREKGDGARARRDARE